MDKNCISIGMCFVPNIQAHFDVRCGAVNNNRHILATGTDQGVIVIWNISSPLVNKIRYKGSLKRFKEIFEKKNGLKLVPRYVLVSNTNSVAFPVTQVEFAVGGSVNSDLSVNEDESKDFKPVEFGEDILLSLHEDSTLCIWSLSSYRCLHKIRGPPFPIRSIKVLPDRRFLAIVGDAKVNIIDIWNIKLIQTLEIYNPEHSLKSSPLAQISSEEMSEVSSTPLINSAPRIVTTSCSIAPPVDCLDDNKNLRNVCALIFVAITTSNEMLLWDLTSSIRSYKSDDSSFNGPVKVVTEWDGAYEVNVPIFLKNQDNLASTKARRSKRHKYPTLSEYMYELEHEQGKICVLDNYVFLMVGYRILVWYYEAHELTRTAELFSFSDDEFSTPSAKWLGMGCVRGRSNDLLSCWLRNGKMRVYRIPEANSKRHFEVIRNYKLPRFRHAPENIELYVRGHSMDDEVIPLYLMYFHRDVYYGVHGFKEWKHYANAVDLKVSGTPKLTCLVEREGRINKIELYSNGEMQAVDIGSYSKERIVSPRIFDDVLSRVSRSWRVRQFIITEAINDHLDRFEMRRTCCTCSVGMLHCTGEYLVLTLERGVLVYSLSSLALKFMINACHFFYIKSVHNICGLTGGEKDTDLVEMTNYFATVDTEGWMVFYNIREIVSSFSGVQDSDHVKIIIDEESIYSNTSIKGQSDFDFLGEEFDLTLSNFFIYRKSYRGIYRIHTRYQLRGIGVDRIALDKNRDLLYVLTSTNVLTWRVTTGCMVYSYMYLSLYRQAILVSSKADYQELKSSLSISETLSMMLNSKTTPEQEEVRIPNYATSLSLFSEKYKRKLKCNLFISHLTLSMKDNRCVETQTHESSRKTRASVNKVGTSGRALVSGVTSKSTVKFVNSKCMLKIRAGSRIRRRCDRGKKGKETGGTVSLNYSIPVLIFTLESLLSGGETDYLTTAKDCLFCYLGVANGSLTIPLKHDLREKAYAMIKKRSIQINKTQSMKYYEKLNVVDAKSHKSKEITLEDFETPLLRKHSDEPILSENLDWKKEVDSTDDGSESSHMGEHIGQADQSVQFEHSQKPEEKFSQFLKDRPPSKSIESRMPCGPAGDQTTSVGSADGDYLDLPITYSSDGKYRVNRYLSTCSFFHDSFLLRNVTIRNYRILRSASTSKDDLMDAGLTARRKHSSGKHELDIWLLVLVLMNTETERSFNKVLECMMSHIRSLDRNELDLHVARALATIHVSQSFKLKGKTNITQIHMCNCNSTVFTFGTKCGSCHKTQSKFDYNQEIKNIKNINEDASLIILALIALDNYLYSLKNSIRMGLKLYTISSYVVQQLMTKLLMLEDNSDLIKANQVQNKTATPKHVSSKNFDLKGFLLDLFAQGFGVVWNLSTFSKQSILPDQIRYTKYSLLFREDFGSAEGICMDNAFFMLFLFQYYHHLNDGRWNKLLLISCSQNTPLAIDVIGWIVKKRKLGNKAIISAIKFIINFMENYMELAFVHLPDLVSIVIKCLDPLDYNIRILLLKPATNALFFLVKNIPMVDFHQDTQRFAVGSQSGFMIIYDIRTATKWRMLLGKQSQIACVAFGSNGSLISAYYHQVPCFMVWKCSSSGLIGSLLSNTSKEYKLIKLKQINVLPTLNQVINIHYEKH
ncbi:hypothetical protein MACJ_002869 [Theileria orientalis]|uniref:Uncharacterized protein n=1 Tax=Theileria orientalis TaxID=68886 RepID=A0A976M991_THEOR|nr:hypothetical protein MACJ_002869 [Theileria orientalis]